MRVECEWGLAGVLALRARMAVLIVVDVLSFSTCVDVAVSRGALVHPFAAGDAAAEAQRLGAALARRRGEGGFSLSPASLAEIPAGTALLLPSPNGARLSLAGGPAVVFAGCLRNAAAVARAAASLGGPIGVIPAGERWPDGSLRPGIEDLLGAGAILHALGGDLSPEALVARDAYRAGELPARIRGSVSGRELLDRCYPQDIDMALALDCSTTAPRLAGGAYTAF